MNILYLGKSCPIIENKFLKRGLTYYKTIEPIDKDFVAKQKFDFCISYGYPFILNEDILGIFNSNIVNLHISYLPWNRGSYPNFWSFFEGTPNGVTIHRIDKGMDTGPILLQEEVIFDINKETLRTSYLFLSATIESLLVKNLEGILNQKIKPCPQEGSGSKHIDKDFFKLIQFLDEPWWDTPVRKIYKKSPFPPV